MADKADGSVILAQRQAASLWECDNEGLSPCGRPFSCLPNLVANEVRMSSWLLLLLELIMLVCYPLQLTFQSSAL